MFRCYRIVKFSSICALCVLSLATGCSSKAATSGGFVPNTYESNSGAAATLASFREYPVPTKNSKPNQIIAGPDGNIWFTEANAPKLGRLSSNGTLTQFAIPSAALGIASGVGDLWFTFSDDYNFNYTSLVGRITVAGKVKLYNVPKGYRTTAGISYGPDAAFWFGASRGCGAYCEENAVIRMTVDGNSWVFPIHKGDNPLWLTRRPDNSVWYTVAGPSWGGFGRTSATGESKFYLDKYDTDSSPEGITVGPDGHLWFTDWTSDVVSANVQDAIGQLTATGQIAARYPIPTENSFPGMIVAGPDGNLWFTESNVDKIGRSTTGGSITEFSLKRGSRPFGMTVSSRGWIWFTELQANKIAEFKP